MTSAFRRYAEGVSSKPGGRLSIASRPGALDDVVLETDEIQGNILGGFNKPFQSILGLKIENPRVFRWRLGELAPRIASATEVLAFNRLYKAIEQRQANGMGSRRGNPVQAVRATWVNIAFSYVGLRKLTDGTSLELASPDDFKDEAFRQGLKERSKQLGEPATGSGSTREWVVGGDDNEADVLIIIASDDRGDLGEEVVWWRTQLEKCAPITFPKNLPRYVREPRMLFHKDSGVEVGAKLPGGKEHFGYRDGISQPGLRGTLSTDPRDVLTPRQNPSNGEQGLPGQDLLWPGEFVFGYPTQVAGGEVTERGPESSAGPEWARNSSFLVFRRLTQDVYAFHSFLESASKNLDLPPEAISDSTDRAAWLGARLVGRWPSGAPVSRTPECDLPDLGENECANNHFAFQTASSAIRLDGMRVGDQTQDTFPSLQWIPTVSDAPSPPISERCIQGTTHHPIRSSPRFRVNSLPAGD